VRQKAGCSSGQTAIVVLARHQQHKRRIVHMSSQAPSRIRDQIATGLMLLCALAAGFALVTSIGAAQNAGPDVQMVETWRLFGFAFFACVFVLLAIRPRGYPGLWEVLIVNKAALTVAGFVLAGQGAAGADVASISDLVLTILLIAAYLLSRGYASWRPAQPANGPLAPAGSPQRD
jgi:hypothetical protein